MSNMPTPIRKSGGPGMRIVLPPNRTAAINPGSPEKIRGIDAPEPESQIRAKGGKNKTFRLAWGQCLCYTQRSSAGASGCFAGLLPGSSVVGQPAVNRLVAGSNPARGASFAAAER